jgi:hypothetical protein
VDGSVELAREGSDWAALAQGTTLRAGDRIRTRSAGLARIEASPSSFTLSGDARLSLARVPVLSIRLEEGRVELHAGGNQKLELSTSEATIRGTGSAVVRREVGRTLVSALAGSFEVAARGRHLELTANTGVVIGAKDASFTRVPLPLAPAGVDPGTDPRYMASNESVALTFVSDARSHHLQVLAIDSDETVIERDVTRPPASLLVPWPGTFRWRVASISDEGLEGPPSKEGLLAVVTR